jgi:hypothetical protein
MTTPAPTKVFVSHKSADSVLADRIIRELKASMDDVGFFLSEEIPKGRDWRKKIEGELFSSSHLLLLYTDSSLDWSWCLYEAILFLENVPDSDDEHHFVYCIHAPGTTPPDPLNRFQTVASRDDDVSNWLSDFYRDTNQSKAFGSLEATASKLVEFLKEGLPKKEKTSNLRPSIFVFPAWSENKEKLPNWINIAKIPRRLPLHLSQIDVTDDISASQLTFSTRPTMMNVVDFLKRLDTEQSPADRPWIFRFLNSLQAALEAGWEIRMLFFSDLLQA